MTPTQALVDELNRERAQLLALTAKLDEAHARIIVYGNWRVQDILAHIASGEKGSLTYAKMICANRPMPATFEGQPFELDRWNEAQVEKRRGKPLAEIMSELNENRRATLAFVAELDEENCKRRGSHPVFKDATVAEVISSIAEADRHHLQEIAGAIAQ